MSIRNGVHLFLYLVGTMKKKVKGHFRLTNKGYVYVKPYTREYKGTQTIDVEDALFKVFSWEGMSLTHSVSRDYSNKEDNIGAAILLGMSSDDGYANMLNQRDTFEGKYLLKKVDSFIDRHGDTPCIGLFSGVPISKDYFKNLKKGRQIHIGSGLPIYTTPNRLLAKSFSKYTTEQDTLPCVFEVVKGTAVGNAKHRSKHEDEQEVCFNSKTKVRVVSSPTPIGEGTKDFHYLVKVSFDK